MGIKYLIEQFKQATGLTNFDYHDKACQKELIEWVKERNKYGEIYGIFLQEHSSINLNSPRCAEVGKSSHDTIILPYKTSMITQHEHKIVDDGKRLILPHKMEVFNGCPAIVFTNRKYNVEFEIIEPETIDTVITQNPYTEGYIKGWDELHKNETSIAIGVYGCVSDKDRETKIRMLRNYRSKLEGLSKEEYGVKQDAYYYFIASSRYVKKRVKTLTL